MESLQKKKSLEPLFFKVLLAILWNRIPIRYSLSSLPPTSLAISAQSGFKLYKSANGCVRPLWGSCWHFFTTWGQLAHLSWAVIQFRRWRSCLSPRSRIKPLVNPRVQTDFWLQCCKCAILLYLCAMHANRNLGCASSCMVIISSIRDDFFPRGSSLGVQPICMFTWIIYNAQPHS